MVEATQGERVESARSVDAHAALQLTVSRRSAGGVRNGCAARRGGGHVVHWRGYGFVYLAWLKATGRESRDGEWSAVGVGFTDE